MRRDFVFSPVFILFLGAVFVFPLGMACAAPASSVVVPPVVSRDKAAPLKLRAEDQLNSVAVGSVPWRRRWYQAVPGEEVIGGGALRYVVQGTETLMELARQFGLGFEELQAANPQVNAWLPEQGSIVRAAFHFVLPLSTANVILNLPEMRVYHRRHDGWVDTYPVGIGREGLAPPLTTAAVVRKQADPTWYVPLSVLKEKPFLPKSVPPGPKNPLGTHAVYLTLPGYLMHGTNKPYGVGRRVSHGCVRFYPEDIIRFFDEVVIRDTVEIVNQPVKAGWQGEQLFLEVHDTLTMSERLRLPKTASTVVSRALARHQSGNVSVDWSLVEQIARRADGMPHAVGGVLQPTNSRFFAARWADRLHNYQSKGANRPVVPVVRESPPPPKRLPPPKILPGKLPFPWQ